MLIDTHCHLNDEAYIDDLDEVIQRAKSHGVARMIVIAYDLNSSLKAVELARKYTELYCAVGIHPADASSWGQECKNTLVSLLDDKTKNKIVAVGEIGLDYHYDDLPVEPQAFCFLEQISLAYTYDLPFIVHDRDAHADCLKIILQAKEKGILRKVPGVFHCYSSSAEFAQQLLKLGFYFGFDGPLTFKKAQQPKLACQAIPLERLLIETDCPYLSPTPYRGKRNEPAYLVEIAKQMAELKELSFEDLAQQTSENALRLFTGLTQG